MNFDISVLLKFNVIDTCSVWNIISASCIYNASLEAGFTYSMSTYVAYECLYKKRNHTNIENLRGKLKSEISKNKFNSYNLSIDDLQDITVLEGIKRLGIGELSSIALAKKTNQTFLTDDRKARKLGEEILGKDRVQTTPRMVGTFFYHRYLIDSHLSVLLQEHQASLTSKWGDLTDFFTSIYQESLRRRLIDSKSTS